MPHSGHAPGNCHQSGRSRATSTPKGTGVAGCDPEGFGFGNKERLRRTESTPQGVTRQPGQNIARGVSSYTFFINPLLNLSHSTSSPNSTISSGFEVIQQRSRVLSAIFGRVHIFHGVFFAG